jgi:hypothetical protein
MDNENTFERVFRESNTSRIRESEGMTAAEFCSKVKDTYAKHFPKSLCVAKIYACLGKSITIDGYLAAGKEEESGGYLDNDMFSIGMFIHDLPPNTSPDSVLPDSMELTSNGSSFTVKPDNPYCAYGRVKVPFRKVTGDAKKILDYLDKYFGRFKDSAIDAREKDLLHKSFTELLDLDEKLGTAKAKKLTEAKAVPKFADADARDTLKERICECVSYIAYCTGIAMSNKPTSESDNGARGFSLWFEDEYGNNLWVKVRNIEGMVVTAFEYTFADKGKGTGRVCSESFSASMSDFHWDYPTDGALSFVAESLAKQVDITRKD